MGYNTNVLKPLNFQHSALKPTLIQGSIQDRRTNIIHPIASDKDKDQDKNLAENQPWDQKIFKNI